MNHTHGRGEPARAGVAASASGITFQAPTGARSYLDQSLGPAGYSEAPAAFRTADPRPTIGIQADGGTQLQCHFDNVFVTQTCGGPGPGCAAICGSFQPSAPLGADFDQLTRSHFLAVDLVDADGNSLASMWVNIDVDTTPPVTQLDGARGVLTNEHDTSPTRPAFNYRAAAGALDRPRSRRGRLRQDRGRHRGRQPELSGARAARLRQGHIDLSLGLLGPGSLRRHDDRVTSGSPSQDRGHGPRIRPLRRVSQLVELRS